jgi:hypothetical protein
VARLAWLALVACVSGQHALTDRAASFWPALALHLGATAAYLWLARAVVRGALRPAFWPALGGALLLHALCLPLAPALSDDIHRYVWEGRLVLEGINPYLHAPAAPDLAHLRGADWASINNPEIPAAYPPAVQLALALGVLLSGGAFGIKLVFGALDVLVFVALWRGLPALGIARERAVVYGWCPLLALEFAGEGHSDSLAVLAMVMALGAQARGRLWLCGGALAVAVAGKLVPIVLLPFLARRAGGARVVVACALGLAALYAPFWAPPAELARGTLEYAGRWRSNDSLFALVHAVGEGLAALGWTEGFPSPWLKEPQRLAKFVLAALALAVLARSWRARHAPEQAAAAFFLFFVAFAPALHPWYVALLVPFLCARPNAGLLAFTGTVYLAYHVLPAWLAERRWEEQAWIKVIEYAPFGLGWLALRRPRGP